MNNKLSVVIVDDEAPARNELSFLLKQLDNVEVVAQAANSQQALELIKAKEPNLVFLDIKMPGQSGLEIAQILQEDQHNNNRPIIIFSTAYDEYAVKAFELNAIDYLLKPYEKERLEKAVSKAINTYQQDQSTYQQMQSKLDNLLKQLEHNSQNQVNRLPVSGERGRVKLLDYQEIIFLSTADGRVYVKTYDQEYNIDLNLTEAEDNLAESNFLRVHRSYLVNLEQIKEVIPWFKGQYKVVMADEAETEISVSRSKVKELKKIFNL